VALKRAKCQESGGLKPYLVGVWGGLYSAHLLTRDERCIAHSSYGPSHRRPLPRLPVQFWGGACSRKVFCSIRWATRALRD